MNAPAERPAPALPAKPSELEVRLRARPVVNPDARRRLVEMIRRLLVR